jgi:hypothetical protein
MLIALTILLIAATAVIALVRQQSQASAQGIDRVRVFQNQRFAVGLLERELRAMGSGVPASQPFLVYGDSQTVVFNADLTANSAALQGTALYLDPDASTASVYALTPASRITIPGTAFTYPDSSYSDGAGNSPAETVTFFFAADTATARTDDYVLYRQANALAPEVVARNLLRLPGQPFFRFHRRIAPSSGTPKLDSIPASRLLFHSVPLHRTPADVGQSALVDSVRAIEVQLGATSGQTNALEQTSRIRRLIRLPNAGVDFFKTCGARPAFNAGLTATVLSVGGSYSVRLQWNASADETGGERDILRYAIYRTDGAGGSWGNPYESVPANGLASYSYDDVNVVPGTTYFYGLAAQDCTPSLSTVASASVTVPSP